MRLISDIYSVDYHLTGTGSVKAIAKRTRLKGIRLKQYLN